MKRKMCSGMSGPKLIRKALERLGQKVLRCWALEKEIERLVEISKGRELRVLSSFVNEILHANRGWLGMTQTEIWLAPMSFLRAIKKSKTELCRAIEALGDLGVPDPPPSLLSKDLDLFMELRLGREVKRVRVKHLALFAGENPELWVGYEVGRDRDWKKITTDLSASSPLHQQVEELIKEALQQYERYLSELEAFKKRFALEHHREILIGEL